MATVISGLTYLNGAVTLGRFAKAPSDVDPVFVTGAPASEPNTVFLDVATLQGFARGGDDVLSALPDFVTVVGDASAIKGFARGGDDVLRGTHFAGDVYGDALTISGFGSGGDDRIDDFVRGGTVLGDAGTMTGFARGGDDEISIGGRFVSAYGDARLLSGHARGGDDVLHLTEHDIGMLVGDGSLSGHARGGDDILYAAPGRLAPATLYGDGETLRDFARAGDDVLVGSAGSDVLWGDGAVTGSRVQTGRDRFVFDADGGADRIMDFEARRDVIDLRALADDGVHGLSDLGIATEQEPRGYTIAIDTRHGTTIEVRSNAVLTHQDFLFA